MTMKTFWVGVVSGFFIGTTASALSIESQKELLVSYTSEAQGFIQDATEKMVKVYKEDSNDYLVNLRLGWLFFLQKKYKNSMEHYIRAAYAAPYSIEPLLGLSQTELAAEDYSKNAETCKLILKLDPGSYIGHQRLVQSQLKLKLYSNALEILNQALLTYPTDPVFLEQKGYALQELGRNEEAIKTLSYLLLLSPHNAYAQFVIDSSRRPTERVPASGDSQFH